MHVLDDQQQRGVGGQCLQQRVHALEELDPVGLAGGAAGGAQQPTDRLQPAQVGIGEPDLLDHARQLVGEPGEELGEGQVREAALAEVEAVPDVHLPSGALRALAELVHQPGLADAGVPGEQHVGGRPGGAGTCCDAEQGGELLQLGVASDQDPTRMRHVRHDPGCGGGSHQDSQVVVLLRSRLRSLRSRLAWRRPTICSCSCAAR